MRRRSRRTPRARPSLMDPKQDVRSHPSCPPLPLPTMLRCCAASGRAFYPIQRPTSSSASTSLTTDRHSSSTTIRKVRLLFHPSGSLGPYGFHAAGTKPYPEPANEAAARFVGENELPEVYVDQVRPTTLVQAWYASERDADLLNRYPCRPEQITSFLRSHVPFASPAPTPAFETSGFAGAHSACLCSTITARLTLFVCPT
jgi:hypothetical protein